MRKPYVQATTDKTWTHAVGEAFACFLPREFQDLFAETNGKTQSNLILDMSEALFCKETFLKAFL